MPTPDVPPFDTLQVATEMCEAGGFDQKQANAIVRVAVRSTANLVTRTHLESALERQMETLRVELHKAIWRRASVSSPDHPPGSPPDGWREHATLEDVYYAYRLYLKRPPDPAGFENYQRIVARGLSLDALIRGFADSDEADADVRPTPIDLGGYQVCVQPRDAAIARGIIATHDYEPHVRRAVRDRLDTGNVVVDIGANVGCIALMAATIVGEAGMVVAVEPNPDNLQMLYAGIVLNGLANVRVLPCAASIRSEVLSLSHDTSNTHLLAARAPGQRCTYTQTVALDEALAWLPRLDLVKFDVEGYEIDAFDGFQASIEKYRPALVIEFNPRCLVHLHQREPAALLDRLLALYPSVRATSAFGDDEQFARTADLLEYWRIRDREVTEAGLLPEGVLHFDLIAERGLPRRIS